MPVAFSTSEEPTSEASSTSEDPTSVTSTSEVPASEASSTSDEPTSVATSTSEEPTSEASSASETPKLEVSSTAEEPTSVASTSEVNTSEASSTSEKPTSEASSTAEEPTSVASISEVPTSKASATSEEPASEASSTSEEPMPVSSTSEEPTSEVSSTAEEPTSEASSTAEEPTSVASISEVPTSVASISEVPTSVASTSEVPTSEASSTSEKPISEASSTSEEVTSVASTSEMPTSEASSTSEEPMPVASSTTEEPTSETSTSEVPTSETSSTSEIPTSVASTSEVPTSEASSTSEEPMPVASSTSEEPKSEISSTSEEPTSEVSSTAEELTSVISSTSEDTTSEASIISEKPVSVASTSEEPASQASSTSEQTTSEASSPSEQTTSEASSTSEQTTSIASSTHEDTTSKATSISEKSTPVASSTPIDSTSFSISEEPTSAATSTSEELTSAATSASEEPTSASTSTSEEPTSASTSTSKEPTSVATTTPEEPTPVVTSTSEEPTSAASSTSEKPTSAATSTSEEPISIATSTSEEPTSVATSTSEEPTSVAISTSEDTSTTQYDLSTVIATISPNITCHCLNENCFVANPEDCTKYFLCEEGSLVSKQCAVGTLFNKDLMKCDIMNNVQCDVSEECSEDDAFYPDKNDCSSYVVCHRGISYRKSCPQGLFYNPSKRTCDLENTCGSDPISPTSRNLYVDCDCETCIMPDSDNCAKYFLCIGGSAYDEYCSNGLLFNPEIGTCDYEDQVSCVVPSPECRTTKNGDVPFVGDCGRFFRCVGGVAYSKDCPEAQHFGEVSGVCEEPCEARCDMNLDCNVTTTMQSMCQDPNGFYPNPSDCRTFYKCTKGKPTLSQCVGDEHFNPVEELCQDPCQAMCDLTIDCPGITRTTTDLSTSGITTISTDKTLDHTTPEDKITTSTSTTDQPSSTSTSNETTDSKDFTSSQKITSILPETSTLTDDIQEETTLSTTPEESLTTGRQTSATDATTSDMMPTTIESLTTDGQTSPSTTSDLESTTSSDDLPRTTRNLSTTEATAFECGEKNGVYPNPSDCGSFYLCVFKRPMALKCNEGMHFSPVTRHCEHPCNAHCDSTLDCSSTEEPESSSPMDLTICHERDVIPKRGHCEYYYDCTSGRRDKERCPRGLHFNPSKRVCDIPHISGCGDPRKPLPFADLYYRCPCENCLVPSRHNCMEYFLCLDSTAYRMKCTGGLLFDKQLNTCNFASKVTCDEADTTLRPESRPPPSSTVRPTSPPSSTVRPQPTTTTPPPISTTRPSRPPPSSTVRPQQTTRPPPSSTTVRPTRPPPSSTTVRPTRPPPSSTTVRPTRPPPSSTIRPTPTTRPTADASTVGPRRYRCKQRDGMFKNPDGCGSFIHCANWWPYVKECPGGLHFSPEKQRCEFPCDARCDKNLACVTTPIPSQDPVCSCRNCFLPNPESCTKYYQCQDGISIKRNCPRGQTFDTNRHICDWAHRSNCKHSESCPRNNGLFAYKGDCHKFVHCSNGIPYVKTCPSGLHFDPEALRCEWPSGKCEYPSLPGPTKGKPTPPPEWQCPSNFGYFRSETNCSNYYLCSHGTPQYKECPKDLVFNSKYQTCDWPQNVNCLKDDHYQQRRCRRFDRQVKCSAERDNSPHDTHCDMFYDCSTGKACPKRCPDGLYFNRETLMCDVPGNVVCKKGDGSQYSLKNFTETCRQNLKGQMRDPAIDACFYRCQRTRVVRGCCAKNRVFNEQKNICEPRRSGPY